MTAEPLVYVIDDDPDFAASLARLLRRSGYMAEPFSDPAALLSAYSLAVADCVLSDVMMEHIDGFSFVGQLQGLDPDVGVVMITGWPRTSDAVDSVKNLGVIDYLEKPVVEKRLLQSVADAVQATRAKRSKQSRLQVLTSRERQVLHLLARGLTTKEIACELAISPRTVEHHRSQIAAKTGAKTLAQMMGFAEGGTTYDLKGQR
jgi:two-component system response regulator FixJ